MLGWCRKCTLAKMDNKLLNTINELLGQELGRNPFGSSIFKWKFSEELKWPAYATGRKIRREHKVLVPLLNGSGSELVDIGAVEPEYIQDRQTIQIQTWFVTKWLSAWDLISGGNPAKGQHSNPNPVTPELQELWNKRFPGAAFPFRGWRVPTSAFLPRFDGGPMEPNLPDTQDFIWEIKRQNSLSGEAVLQDMLDQMDTKDALSLRPMLDELENEYSALLNPAPGKRGGSHSFPGTSRAKLVV